MPGWLSRTLGSFRRVSAVPSEFHAVCRCGGGAGGLRTDRSQIVPCSTCGEMLFVLPASPYPPVPGRKPKPAKKKAGSKKRGGKSKQAADEVEPAVAVAPPPVAAWRPAVDRLVVQARRAATPFRLVVLGISLALVATALGAWHQRSVRLAGVTLVEAARAGDAALAADRLDDAAVQFARVRDALALLGRSDPESRRLGQRAQEVEAAANLLPTDLFALLEEGVALEAAGGGLDWQDALPRTTRGSWLVVETSSFHPDELVVDPTRRIDLAITVGQQPVQLVIDLAPLEKVLVDARPARLLFAAQVVDCRPVRGASQGWELILDGRTAFLWAFPDTCRFALGELDDATEKLLDSQARLLEVQE